MTGRSRARATMALAGAALIVAGVLVGPGAGGAEELPVPVPSTSTLPAPLAGTVDTVKDTTGPTPDPQAAIDEATGNTAPSSTSTTVAPTTTTTAPPATTTTTAPATTAEETTNAEESKQEHPIADAFSGFYDHYFDEHPLPTPDAYIAQIGGLPTIDPINISYTPVGGRRSTQDVIDMLAPLGLSPEQVAQVMAPFPVSGSASYSDDWGAPRHTPEFHTHEGTDIFAETGTPVVAVFDGVVSQVSPNTAVGGNAVYLKMPDGTYFYYAHLDGFAPDLSAGEKVNAGDVLGFVGDTGNAEGGVPHLHFEIHPGGGEPVPPVRYLDAWLDQARAEAGRLAGAGPAVGPVAPLDIPTGQPLAGSLAGQGAGAGANAAGPLFVALLVAVVGLRRFGILRRRDLEGVLAAEAVAPLASTVVEAAPPSGRPRGAGRFRRQPQITRRRTTAISRQVLARQYNRHSSTGRRPSRRVGGRT